MTDFYGLLGVAPDASPEDIRDAYYRYVHYPEQFPYVDPGAMQHAYVVLSDPERRATYDASQRAAGADAYPSDRDRLTGYRLPPPKRSGNPIVRITQNLPRGWRIAIEHVRARPTAPGSAAG